MIRNLKALGLALFALMAMGAMTAVSASAQEGEITATAGSAYPVHLQGGDVAPTAGEPTASLTGPSGTIECTNALYTANLAAPANQLTISASYAGCATTTGNPVTVTMNSCDYKFHHLTTLAGGTTDQWTVTANVECTKPTDVIEIHEYSSAANHAANVSNCTATVPVQSGLTGGKVTEETGANDALEITGSIKPKIESHGACSFGLTLNLDSTLHLSATVTGTEGKKVGLSHKG